MRLSPLPQETFLTYIVFQRVTTSVTKLLTFIVTHLSHFYHSILLFAVCIVFCTKWHFSGVKRQWMPKKGYGLHSLYYTAHILFMPSCITACIIHNNLS
nr:MAG TPA: hypothetical protein [Caudoviricetes sp.]